MNTTETNKKFAEFLGWEINDDLTIELPYKLANHWQGESRKEDYLQFHNDWNWLMLVVKTISDKTGYELVSGYGYSYWNEFGNNPLDIEFGGYEDIMNIYEACNAFIDWYTAQKELK